MLRHQTDELVSSSAQTKSVDERTREFRRDFDWLQMYYQFGIEEVRTKVNILRQEFEKIHTYSPIEHVRYRLKSFESLLDKIARIDCDMSIPAIRETIRDIAGIRITCSFVSDVYWIASMLGQQTDLTVVETKDYIDDPKPNGYQSLHLIVRVPVFLSDHTEHIFVELQIRTIAMDFWASVEHKLTYKYPSEIPDHLQGELDAAARAVSDLDARMAHLRDEIRSMDTNAHLPREGY